MRHDLSAVTPEIQEVALINGARAAAIGSMSISWWHERVAAGVAPQPAVRSARCTRWRYRDVIDFWRRFADEGSNPEQADRLLVHAANASAAARTARGTKRGHK